MEDNVSSFQVVKGGEAEQEKGLMPDIPIGIQIAGVYLFLLILQ